MKKLTLAFIALIFISCSDNGAGVDPEKNGKIIGSWEVFDSKAYYIGQQPSQNFSKKAKTDTIYYSNPPAHTEMFVQYVPKSAENKLFIHYTDSTINKSVIDYTKYGTSIEYDSRLGSGTGISGIDHHRLSVDFDMTVSCGDSTVNNEHITLKLTAGTDEAPMDETRTLRLYKFDVDGLQDVAFKLMGC